MIVRLRFVTGPSVKKTAGKNRHVALAMGALLTPVTLMMFVMAIWRIAADINVATEFPIIDGLWSHWQVWVAATGLSHFITVLLNRYGRTGALGLQKSVANGLSVFATKNTSTR